MEGWILIGSGCVLLLIVTLLLAAYAGTPARKEEEEDPEDPAPDFYEALYDDDKAYSGLLEEDEP